MKDAELEPEWVAPTYDFIQYRKFEPREIALPGGDVRIEAPAASVSGWPRIDILDLEHTEKDPASGEVTDWRIVVRGPLPCR